MEKLELKHLENYLRSKMKVYDTRAKKSKIMNLGQGSSVNWVGIKTVLNYSSIYKPILRPKIDLFKQIEYKGEMITPCHYLAKLAMNNKNFLLDIVSNKYSYHTLIYNVECQDFLNELHFDWRYNLIEKGLAVDINTLK